MLDGNEDTVEDLRREFKNALVYKAPDTLPFDDHSVSYVHSSHMIEHLSPDDLYVFIKEVDRVLSRDGVLVISTPLLWSEFFVDLSHIKPYHPDIFRNYLCGKSDNRSASVISDKYSLLELVYRFADVLTYSDFNEGLGHAWAPVDLVVQTLKRFFFKIGFKSYKKNGYTIVSKKSK